MRKHIKYIGFYDSSINETENRMFALAATNKMDYIISVLNYLDYEVLIVSPSRTKNKKYYGGKILNLGNNVRLKLFPTLPWGTKVSKLFSVIFTDLLLFFYLLSNVRKDEEIIVYHSVEFKNILRLAKKIKKFNMILEVEEIYQDINKYNSFLTKEEFLTIDCADKYVFSNELLNNRVNKKNKQKIVSYGTYNIQHDRNVSFEDEKIHVVYSGTFDMKKKGALLAIEAAEFLSEEYHIHIIGFGTKVETDFIIENINKVSIKSKAKITYDGLLIGEEYIKFLQKCHIGLSTQVPEGIYNETSFPSKILSYMSNGLEVVSIETQAIKLFDSKNLIHFFKKADPKEVSEKIQKVNIHKSSKYNKELIIELDKEFKESFKLLLGD